MANQITLPTELEQKIDEVNQWMFYGDKLRVARKAKKDPDYVGKVLSKQRFSAAIIEAAIEVMNENKARFEIKQKMHIA
jgi:hypothetical protein